MNVSTTTTGGTTTTIQNTTSSAACPQGTLCCVIENFNVESNGVQINIFNTGVVALVFASILLIMCRMQGTAVRQQLPVYYNYLLFTCATFFIVIVLLLLPRGSTTALAWRIVAELLIAPQWIVQLGVVFFLFSLDANASAGWRAFKHSSLFALVLIVVHVVPIAASPQFCAYCGAIVAQVVLCIFFLLALVLSVVPTRFPARPALRWWAGYQLVAHVIFLTQYILYVLQPEDEVTDCIDVIALAGYYLAYAPILLVVVAADSAYWRSHGALLRHYQQQSLNGEDDAADIEDREQDQRESQPQPQFGGSDDSAASRLVHASLSSGNKTADSPSLSVSSGGGGGEYTSSTQTNVIDYASLEVGGVLGVGQFGVVHEGKFRARPVAIKLLRQLPSSAISDVMRDLLRESRMMLALRSEHVVECVGVILDDDHLGIVTELMEISMWDALHNTTEASRDVWPLHRTVSLMGDVARGLQYLHTRRPPIIHRDIKCHAKDTPILMADGSVKRVQCVAVGDRVMGDDGSARRVLSLSSGRDQQLVEIGAQSSKCALPSFRCNLAHVLSLTVANYPRRIGATTVQFVAAEQSTDGTTLSLCIVERVCGSAAEAYALVRCTDQRALQCAFNVADNVVLVVRDRVIDIAVHDLLYNVTPPSLVACLELHFAGALKFESSCIDAQCDAYEFGRNQMIDRVPVELKRGSIATRSQLLAGVLDRAARFIGMPMACRKLADDLAFVARSLGLRAAAHDRSLDVWGDVSRLPLQTRVAPPTRRTARERLQMTLCGRGDFYGFELDGNHRYVLADSFMVTHNSHNILLRFTRRPVMPARAATVAVAAATTAAPADDPAMRVGSPDNTVAPSAAKPASSKRLLEWSWSTDDDTPIAKLCDLGVSRAKLGTTHMTRVGTPQWASPEILRDEPYNEKTDIFSFGIVWWECLTRKKPFVSMSPMRVISAVSMDHLRLPLPGDVPRPLAALVKQMWNSTPTKRPSATEVLYQLRDFEQQ